MGFIPLLLLGLGIAVAAWLSWISIQSLLQARLLFRLARRPSDAPDAYGRHAVYGRVAVSRALRPPIGIDVLWCRTQQQVYRRRRKNSGWSTVSTEDEVAGFTIAAHGGSLRVSGLPTEVQGTASTRVVHDQSGWLWGHGDGDRRTLYTYLPVVTYATLVGRREGEAFVRDNKLGLFLSPHEPGKAAWLETWKGVGGLLLVTAAITLGLVFYSQSQR